MISARCYCGHVNMQSEKPPLTVAFCHCSDCKRWTGAPAPAFAAFELGALRADPDLGTGTQTNAGVARWNCPKCHSPLATTFDYLPNQIYVPLGLIDQAETLPAQVHCHAESQLPWLHINDDATRTHGTARDRLLKGHHENSGL